MEEDPTDSGPVWTGEWDTQTQKSDLDHLPQCTYEISRVSHNPKDLDGSRKERFGSTRLHRSLAVGPVGTQGPKEGAEEGGYTYFR